ncbi:Rho-binding antiterminator [Enterobacterales bacterium CwR94]|nr:Rho-binding antiterminator [Enterobacterales bacterium CwR94]
MSMNDTYEPINCDAYDILEDACEKKWTLTLTLKNGERLTAKAKDIVSRKNVEYLTIDVMDETRELRLDHIATFEHDKLGTVDVTAD